MRKMTYIHLSLLKSIDFRKNVFKHAVAGGTEIFAAGTLCNSPESGLVNHNRLRLEFDTAGQGLNGIRSISICSDADSINFDSQFFGNLRCCDRCDYTGIIRTVGQQNYDFAFGFSFFESVESRSDAIADCRSVLKNVHSEILKIR